MSSSQSSSTDARTDSSIDTTNPGSPTSSPSLQRFSTRPKLSSKARFLPSMSSPTKVASHLGSPLPSPLSISLPSSTCSPLLLPRQFHPESTVEDRIRWRFRMSADYSPFEASGTDLNDSNPRYLSFANSKRDNWRKRFTKLTATSPRNVPLQKKTRPLQVPPVPVPSLPLACSSKSTMARSYRQSKQEAPSLSHADLLPAFSESPSPKGLSRFNRPGEPLHIDICSITSPDVCQTMRQGSATALDWKTSLAAIPSRSASLESLPSALLTTKRDFVEKEHLRLQQMVQEIVEQSKIGREIWEHLISEMPSLGQLAALREDESEREAMDALAPLASDSTRNILSPTRSLASSRGSPSSSSWPLPGANAKEGLIPLGFAHKQSKQRQKPPGRLRLRSESLPLVPKVQSA